MKLILALTLLVHFANCQTDENLSCSDLPLGDNKYLGYLRVCKPFSLDKQSVVLETVFAEDKSNALQLGQLDVLEQVVSYENCNPYGASGETDGKFFEAAVCPLRNDLKDLVASIAVMEKKIKIIQQTHLRQLHNCETSCDDFMILNKLDEFEGNLKTVLRSVANVGDANAGGSEYGEILEWLFPKN